MTSAVLPRRPSLRPATWTFAALGVTAAVLVTLVLRLLAAPPVVGGLLAAVSVLAVGLFWAVQRGKERLREREEELEERARELVAARDEQRSLREQLVAAERIAIGDMAAAVAHGIRNPLANIRACAQVALLDCPEAAGSGPAARSPGLTGDAPRSDGRRSLTNIIGEVDLLDRRLRELLQFARPERQCQPMDLNGVLRSARETVDGRLAQSGVEVEERLAPELPAMTGDALLVEHVFATLLDNAIDAMPGRGGRVTLRTGLAVEEGRPRVYAEVQDTGEGISSDRLSRIFDFFYSTKAHGTGLGLAVAKKIIDGHRGRIMVESRPGEGSCFRVSFPARRED